MPICELCELTNGEPMDDCIECKMMKEISKCCNAPVVKGVCANCKQEIC